MVHAVAHFKAHTKFVGKLDAAALHHFGAGGGHFEHLLIADLGDLLCALHDTRIAGIDAIDIGVDLAKVSFDGRCHGDGGQIAAATTQRGDFSAGGLALEAGEHDDVAFVEHFLHGIGRDVDDAGLRVHAVGGNACLSAS